MVKFQRGDKVTFEKDGKELSGTIHAVGKYLAGVEVGIAYHTVEVGTLSHATPTRKAGFMVGDKALVTANDVGFEVGTIVTLFRDDGSFSPLWEGPNLRYRNVYDDVRGRLEGAFLHLSCVEKMPADGPKEGVLWTDAPKGATHYSLADDHAEKWHKLEDGEWSYHSYHGWNRYIDEDFAMVETQVALPKEYLVALPVVKVVAPTPEAVVVWEKGDVIQAISEDSMDITNGNFYILTEDADKVGLQFRDNDNYPRIRAIRNYKLVLKRNK